MLARDRVLETIQLLDEEAVLKVYDLALTLMDRKRPSNVCSLNMENIQKIQRSLASIYGNLSDDIQQEREERYRAEILGLSTEEKL
ncbi:MAG: hypothetical protein HQM12_07580 [SAR324 cluster bacterium]|nr:hypothetical protein [SAR324 cluster bacterium]